MEPATPLTTSSRAFKWDAALSEQLGVKTDAGGLLASPMQLQRRLDELDKENFNLRHTLYYTREQLQRYGDQESLVAESVRKSVEIEEKNREIARLKELLGKMRAKLEARRAEGASPHPSSAGLHYDAVQQQEQQQQVQEMERRMAEMQGEHERLVQALEHERDLLRAQLETERADSAEAAAQFRQERVEQIEREAAGRERELEEEVAHLRSANEQLERALQAAQRAAQQAQAQRPDPRLEERLQREMDARRRESEHVAQLQGEIDRLNVEMVGLRRLAASARDDADRDTAARIDAAVRRASEEHTRQNSYLLARAREDAERDVAVRIDAAVRRANDENARQSGMLMARAREDAERDVAVRIDAAVRRANEDNARQMALVMASARSEAEREWAGKADAAARAAREESAQLGLLVQRLRARVADLESANLNESTRAEQDVTQAIADREALAGRLAAATGELEQVRRAAAEREKELVVSLQECELLASQLRADKQLVYEAMATIDAMEAKQEQFQAQRLQLQHDNDVLGAKNKDLTQRLAAVMNQGVNMEIDFTNFEAEHRRLADELAALQRAHAELKTQLDAATAALKQESARAAEVPALETQANVLLVENELRAKKEDALAQLLLTHHDIIVLLQHRLAQVFGGSAAAAAAPHSNNMDALVGQLLRQFEALQLRASQQAAAGKPSAANPSGVAGAERVIAAKGAVVDALQRIASRSDELATIRSNFMRVVGSTEKHFAEAKQVLLDAVQSTEQRVQELEVLVRGSQGAAGRAAAADARAEALQAQLSLERAKATQRQVELETKAKQLQTQLAQQEREVVARFEERYAALLRQSEAAEQTMLVCQGDLDASLARQAQLEQEQLALNGELNDRGATIAALSRELAALRADASVMKQMIRELHKQLEKAVVLPPDFEKHVLGQLEEANKLVATAQRSLQQQQQGRTRFAPNPPKKDLSSSLAL